MYIYLSRTFVFGVVSATSTGKEICSEVSQRRGDGTSVIGWHLSVRDMQFLDDRY